MRSINIRNVNTAHPRIHPRAKICPRQPHPQPPHTTPPLPHHIHTPQTKQPTTQQNPQDLSAVNESGVCGGYNLIHYGSVVENIVKLILG